VILCVKMTNSESVKSYCQASAIITIELIIIIIITLTNLNKADVCLGLLSICK